MPIKFPTQIIAPNAREPPPLWIDAPELADSTGTGQPLDSSSSSSSIVSSSSDGASVT